MNKPNAIIQLLDDLRAEGTDSTVVTIKGSHAKISERADGDTIFINREECELLLHSPDTVEMLCEALGNQLDLGIELHELSIDDEVQEALERRFATVEEV